MDHHVNLFIRPDPEFPAHVLMSALMAKLHRGLDEASGICGAIGVSFPAHSAGRRGPPTLGNRLRLHGMASSLEQLMCSNWLTGMRDHAEADSIAAAPPDAPHRLVRRVQAQSSPDRLRRRLARRHGLDEAEARERIPDGVAQTLDLPFVQVRSSSTGQTFLLFIAHGPLLEAPVAGRFSAYGLSLGASVPWF